MTTASDVVRVARTYLGTPWAHQGRLKGVAIDCAGLIVGVARELALPHIDVPAYGHLPDGVLLRGYCEDHLDPVAWSELRPGDLVLMTFTAVPQHLGILGDAGQPRSLIHAYAQVRRCVEHGFTGPWPDRVVQGYRFRGLER